MRILMQVILPVEGSNETIINGTLPKTIQSILSEQKPEVAYFFAQDGKRGGIIVLDMKDTSQIPAFAEPWFLTFNASVKFPPVMNAKDLAKAAPSIQQAVEKYAARPGKAATAR